MLTRPCRRGALCPVLAPVAWQGAGSLALGCSRAFAAHCTLLHQKARLYAGMVLDGDAGGLGTDSTPYMLMASWSSPLSGTLQYQTKSKQVS